MIYIILNSLWINVIYSKWTEKNFFSVIRKDYKNVLYFNILTNYVNQNWKKSFFLF